MAKKNVGKLNVILNAITGPFTRKMKGAGKTVRGFQGSVGASAKKLAGFGVALAGIGAGVGLTAMVKGSLKTMDATAKLSDRLGIATEDIGRFQHAANIMGVEQETLNKSLEQFVRRLGEAKGGTGEAKDALDLLGLNAAKLSEQSPAESFIQVSEALSKMETQADKADAAYGIFGRTGLKLMNVMSIGRKGIEELGQEADALGLTFSRETAAKAEMANDAIARMTAAMTGVWQVIAIKLAPFVTLITDKFTAMAKSGDGIGAKVGGAFSKIIGLAAKLMDWISLIKSGFFGLQAGVLAFSQGITKIYSLLLTLKAKISKFMSIIPGFKAVADQMGLGPDQLRSMANMIDTQAKDLGNEREKAWSKASDSYDAFVKGRNSKSVANYMKESEQAAKKIAADAAKNAGVATRAVAAVAGSAGGIKAPTTKGPSAAKAVSPGEFSQVIRSRLALGTAGGGRKKESPPELGEMVMQLRFIRELIAGGGMSRAG